jgi:diguanylate cyclase (GGDEF)-like protein
VRIDDVVARFGGDEFTVLVTNGFDPTAVEAVCGQIVVMVGAPYTVHGNVVEIRASVGFASFPQHGESVEELLCSPDQAMCAAKRAGGGGTRTAGSQDTHAA